MKKKTMMIGILIIVVIIVVNIGGQEKVVSGEDLISKFGETEITRVSLTTVTGEKRATLEPNDIKKFIEVLSNTNFKIINSANINNNEKIYYFIFMGSDYREEILDFMFFGEEKVQFRLDVGEKREYSQHALIENPEFIEVIKQMLEEKKEH